MRSVQFGFLVFQKAEYSVDDHIANSSIFAFQSINPHFFSKFVTKIAYLFNYIYEENVRLRGPGQQKLAFAAIAGCKLCAPLWNKDSCRQQTRLKMANQSLSSLQLSIFSIFAGRKSPRGAHRQLGPAETRPFQPLFSLQFLHLPFFAGRNCRTTLKLAATPTCRN